jgi:glycosyltransferase involved in cell wall biosynthesis
LSAKPRSSASGNEEKPLVSIIVPTKDSSRTLPITLNSIKAQTYNNIELIVVDNYSTDATSRIAESYGARFFLRGNERSAQVNFGVSNAMGKYVYEVGSDFYLEPTVVEEAAGACVRGATAVLIHNTSDPTISFWARVRKLERDCYKDDEWHVAIRFMLKADFERVGGELENLVAAEDYDLHNRLLRLGVRVSRIRAQEVHLGEPKKLAEVVRKHIYYGEKIGEFIRENPKTYWLQIAPIRLSYFHHWRDFTKDPRVTLGFFLYQYVRYASAFVGYLARMAA